MFENTRTLRFNIGARVCESPYKHFIFVSFVPKALQSHFKPPQNSKELSLHQSFGASFVSWIDAWLEAIDLSQIRDKHQAMHPSSTMRISFRSLGRWLFSLKRQGFLFPLVLQIDFISSSVDVLEWISCLPPTNMYQESQSKMMQFHLLDHLWRQAPNHLPAISPSSRKFAE